MRNNQIQPRWGKKYTFGDMEWNTAADGNQMQQKKTKKRDPKRKYWYVYEKLPKSDLVRHDTTLHYITLQYTTLHYTTPGCIILNKNHDRIYTCAD